MLGQAGIAKLVPGERRTIIQSATQRRPPFRHLSCPQKRTLRHLPARLSLKRRAAESGWRACTGTPTTTGPAEPNESGRWLFTTPSPMPSGNKSRKSSGSGYATAVRNISAQTAPHPGVPEKRADLRNQGTPPTLRHTNRQPPRRTPIQLRPPSLRSLERPQCVAFFSGTFSSSKTRHRLHFIPTPSASLRVSQRSPTSAANALGSVSNTLVKYARATGKFREASAAFPSCSRSF
jgi:hypothetical protein